MDKLTPCLWFDFNAEEAVEFWLSVFKDGKVIDVTRYGDSMPQYKGKVLVIRYELAGQHFMGLNGGPQYKFSEAVSLSVNCKDQAEVDYYWNALSAGGGEEGPCGWLKDRFGFSWQIVPEALPRLLNDPDKARAQRVFGAMMEMRKIDIAKLEAAGDGR
jgi:predicted 3-demethylubiquinone-9 3-methyltransferase (glyoxalase superfamily)